MTTAVPSPVAHESDPPMSPVAARMVARFRRMLADMFPTDSTLDRYRESDGADTDEHAVVVELCADCQWYPATFRGRCFACHTNDRRPAA